MDGKTFDKLKQYYPDMLSVILIRTKVFARFQPDQKTQLIVLLQEMDFVVSMVGDGANDCGVSPKIFRFLLRSTKFLKIITGIESSSRWRIAFTG